VVADGETPPNNGVLQEMRVPYRYPEFRASRGDPSSLYFLSSATIEAEMIAPPQRR